MSKDGTVLTTSGYALSYSIDGAEGAPWLILSNSLATDRRMWGPQIAAFSAGRRVLRYDTRGHGQSGVVDTRFGFSDLADDLVQVMDALEIETAELVGLSMGGMTSLAMAIRHPDRVSKVVCADARADAPDPYKAIWDGNIARVRESGMASIADGTMERWFTEEFRADPANKATMDLVRDMIVATPAAGYIRAAECLQSLALLPNLGKIACPSLYVTGENDPAAPIPVMQAMADATPGARLKVVPGAAHLSNMESPTAFSETVLAFLD